MKPILRLPELRELESRHAAADPSLMERAGAAATDLILELLEGRREPALIVCGPGNNGGDGLVAARFLKERGHTPVVVFAGDPARLPPDAARALEAWRWMGGHCHEAIPAGTYALAVDALFGIGLTRPVEGRHAELVAAMESLGCPVLSLDIPSGLDSETGRLLGRAVRADRTLSFIALKPGLLTLDGPDHCGAVTVADLGLGPDFGAAGGRVLEKDIFQALLRPRPRNSHKGSFGSAGILGGAPGMAGAALLAGRAALKLGAGRVHVGMLERLAVDPVQPELMLREAAQVLSLATALAIGPGLGDSAPAVDLLRAAIAAELPLVLDADALNLLAAHPSLARELPRRRAPTLLTPHPAEAARLLGSDTAAVQGDRLAAALELARRFRADTVLKGAGSVVASADGAWSINASGNPGLASAGSGDVLTGIVLALLAQGWPADAALAAAVHLHGEAAEWLVAAGVGPVGMAAGELIDSARHVLNTWIA